MQGSKGVGGRRHKNSSHHMFSKPSTAVVIYITKLTDCIYLHKTDYDWIFASICSEFEKLQCIQLVLRHNWNFVVARKDRHELIQFSSELTLYIFVFLMLCQQGPEVVRPDGKAVCLHSLHQCYCHSFAKGSRVHFITSHLPCIFVSLLWKAHERQNGVRFNCAHTQPQTCLFGVQSTVECKLLWCRVQTGVL